MIDWIKVLRPTQHKIGILETFPKPISWLGMENLSPKQQKHTFTNQKKYTTTQNKHKHRYSHLLRHPAWKQRGSILIWVLHKFVTYLLTLTLSHLLTAPGSTHNTINVNHHTMMNFLHTIPQWHAVLLGLSVTDKHCLHQWTWNGTAVIDYSFPGQPG